MFKKALLISMIAFVVTGCQSTAATSQASKILVSPNPAPKGCKYVGQVTGNQGNFFTGSFTSNKNLEQGAMNTLKNEAAKLGANYVQMLTNRAGESGGAQGVQQQTNVVVTGNAYSCPKLD